MPLPRRGLLNLLGDSVRWLHQLSQMLRHTSVLIPRHLMRIRYQLEALLLEVALEAEVGLVDDPVYFTVGRLHGDVPFR